MNRYDPDQTPNPEQWLALNEKTRIRLAEDHHRAARIKLPNLKAHAVFHAIVENPIAENTESVVRAMARLTTEGLPRHEAIHAIASVLAEHIHDLFNAKADENNSAAVYNAAVERLTAKGWRGAPNPSIQGTPEKLRFSVPSRLRRSVAPDLELQGLPHRVQVF